jgi:hypothetical protein
MLLEAPLHPRDRSPSLNDEDASLVAPAREVVSGIDGPLQGCVLPLAVGMQAHPLGAAIDAGSSLMHNLSHAQQASEVTTLPVE